MKKRKKLNRKGFTLIELLAVITIMGILMIVAIPAVQRTIENSRRGTFANTAQNYLNAIKTAVSADEIKCSDGNMLSAKGTGYYYYPFYSGNATGQDLLEQGGKSSWNNQEVAGVIVIHKTLTGTRAKYDYGMAMTDASNRGFGGTTLTAANSAFSTVVLETNIIKNTVSASNGDGRSYVKKNATPSMVSSGTWKYGSTDVTTAPVLCGTLA